MKKGMLYYENGMVFIHFHMKSILAEYFLTFATGFWTSKD